MLSLLEIVYRKFLNKNFVTSILLLSLFSLLLCITSGCSIFSAQSERKVNYFDIGFPETSSSTAINKPLVIGDFISITPYFARMAFRTSETYLEFDDYNRWSSNPAQMLQRYFILALDNKGIDEVDKKNDFLELNATILSLEADTENKIVTLILRIEVLSGNSEAIEYSEIIRIEEPLKEITANQFAISLKVAVDKAVDKTKNILSKIVIKSGNVK